VGARRAFVHEAELELSPGADDRAPGGAITVALCGHWEHAGQCRWPHQTEVTRRSKRRIALRTVFAGDPAEEELIRDRIVTALRAGRLNGPSGLATWRVTNEAPSTLHSHEHQLAARLTTQTDSDSS
jgi:hypothetical protein